MTDAQSPPGAALERVALCDLLLERMESGALELPLLPDATARVLDAVRDDQCDARRLADTIQRDQALAGHVLRVANSAGYRPSQPIVSLSQAVSRLGFQTLGEIAMAVTLKGRVFKAARFEKPVRELWRHSAAAGAYAKEIARLRRRNVEGAFLCGLLHDVGRPVILQAAVDLEKSAGRSFTDHDVLGAADTLHCRVGARMIHRWSLPDWMESAIAWHHGYEQATSHRDEVMMTALANRLAHWALEADDDDRGDFEQLPLLIDLNIYEDELLTLQDARDHVRDVAQAFA